MNLRSYISYRHTLLSRSRGYLVSQRANSTYPVGKEHRRPVLLLKLRHCVQLRHVYNVESNTLCHIQGTNPVMQCHLLMPSSRLFVNCGFSVTHTITLLPMTPYTNTQQILLSLLIRACAYTHTHTHTHTHTQCSSLRKIMPTQHTFFRVLTAPVFLDLLIVEVSRSHSDTPHSVRLVWTSDQPIAETST